MQHHNHHAERCNAGDANLRPHKAVQHTLARILKEAGAQVDIERHEPMLYTWEKDKEKGWKIKEAIMDVTTYFPGCHCAHLIDVSVRTPHTTGSSATDTNPGVAAEDGEASKTTRYGKTVLPLIFETYGRLGPRSIQTLRTLADSAQMLGLCKARKASSWRRQLEKAVVWADADRELCSLGRQAYEQHFTALKGQTAGDHNNNTFSGRHIN